MYIAIRDPYSRQQKLDQIKALKEASMISKSTTLVNHGERTLTICNILELSNHYK